MDTLPAAEPVVSPAPTAPTVTVPTPSASVAASPAGLREADIVGLKYFDQLVPLLKRLRDDGCDRDKAGYRELQFDQDAALVLLYLFNPICSSLRAVQQASELLCVQ